MTARHGSSARFPWFRSSYSNGAGGECVECGRTAHGVLVRDSKAVPGPVVALGAEAWSAFVASPLVSPRR